MKEANERDERECSQPAYREVALGEFMTPAMNIESIETATGESSDNWLNCCERNQASDPSHTQIAQKVSEQKGATGWPVQTLMVDEEHIALRKLGQKGDCKNQFTAGRSGDGTRLLASLFEAFVGDGLM